MSKEHTQITFEFLGSGVKPNDPADASGSDSNKPAISKTRGRKKLKDAEAEVEHVDVPDDEILFQKQYYSIGEVAAMFNVNNSLLRHWEKEFDILTPRKNRKGDRFFKPTDVKNLQLIHDLLRRRKFTIEGAKDYLKKSKQVNERQELIQSLQRLRAFLLQLKATL